MLGTCASSGPALRASQNARFGLRATATAQNLRDAVAKPRKVCADAHESAPWKRFGDGAASAFLFKSMPSIEWKAHYESKCMTAPSAIAMLRSGMRVLISSGAAEPVEL